MAVYEPGIVVRRATKRESPSQFYVHWWLCRDDEAAKDAFMKFIHRYQQHERQGKED